MKLVSWLPFFALSVFACGELFARDTVQSAAGSYSLKTTKTGIHHLFLDDYPMPAALKLIENHMSATITIDKDVQKEVAARKLSMTFGAMSWRDVLISLVVSEGFHLKQSGKTHYHISTQHKGTESFEETGKSNQ